MVSLLNLETYKWAIVLNVEFVFRKSIKQLIYSIFESLIEAFKLCYVIFCTNVHIAINFITDVFSGDPLHVGMDLTIASFDAISEVNMVSSPKSAYKFAPHNDNLL